MLIKPELVLYLNRPETHYLIKHCALSIQMISKYDIRET